MKLHHKIGFILMAWALLTALALQKFGSLIYRPDNIHAIEIVPPPPDLTPVLVFLSTNWFLAGPLALTFVLGVVCVFLPKRYAFDEPQLVEIKYVN